MKSLKIDIHSIVDVITNSSTVIYVEATKNTIKTIKEMVNHLLSIGGSDKKADDLFTFELEDKKMAEWRGDFIRDKLHEEEFDKIETWQERNELQIKYYNKYSEEKPKWWNPDQLTEKQREKFEEKYEGFFSDYEDDYSYKRVSLMVTPKEDSKEIKEIANILSDLTSIFNIESSYDS